MLRFCHGRLLSKSKMQKRASLSTFEEKTRVLGKSLPYFLAEKLCQKFIKKTLKMKKNITRITSFFTKLKKMEIFAFCVLTFEPIIRYRPIQHLKMAV